MAKARRETKFFLLSLPYFLRSRIQSNKNSPRCTKLISCGPSPTIGTKRRFFLLLARQGRGRGRVVASHFFFERGLLLSERRPDEQVRADLPESRRGQVDAHFSSSSPERARRGRSGRSRRLVK